MMRIRDAKKNISNFILLAILVFLNAMFFSVSKTNAYFQFNKTIISTFVMATYQNLELSTDKEIYGLCNKSATILLTIGNTNGYNMEYVISFSNNDLEYTIDGEPATTYTLNANGSRTHTIVVSGTTTTDSVTINVTSTSPYEKIHNKVVNLDLECPICTWDEVNDTNQYIGNGQTKMYTISCVDSAGINNTDLTASSFTVSNAELASISEVTKTSITDGYAYTVSLLGQTGYGNISLSMNTNVVRDNNTNGNISVTSETIIVDTTEPAINSANSAYTAINGTLTATATDSTTGLVGYAFTNTNVEPVAWTPISITTDEVTVSQEVTLGGIYYVWFQDAALNVSSMSILDTTPPSCTWSNGPSISPVRNGQTSIFELSCQDLSGFDDSTILSSNITVASDNGSVTIDTPIKSDIQNGYKFTFTVTAANGDGDVTLILDENSVSDIYGNMNIASLELSALVLDNTPPTNNSIIINNNDNYASSTNVTLTLNSTGAETMCISNTTTCTEFVNYTTSVNHTLASHGTVYAIFKDAVGNVSAAVNDTIIYDVTSPTITVPNNVYVRINRNSPLLSFASIIDNGSGVASSSATVNGVVKQNVNGMASGNYTLIYTATDNAGNTSTVNKNLIIYTKIEGDISPVTSGAGFYADANASGGYIYKGTDPNNYLTFNNATAGWRIMGRLPDNSYKIISNVVLTAKPKYDDNPSRCGKSAYACNTFGTKAGVTSDSYIKTYLNGSNYLTASTFHVQSRNQLMNHSINQANVIRRSTATIADVIDQENDRTTSARISLLTISDIMKASSKTACTIFDSDVATNCGNNYLRADNKEIWTLSGHDDSWYFIWTVNGAGTIQHRYPTKTDYYTKPVAYLKSGSIFTGTGTATNPYVPVWGVYLTGSTPTITDFYVGGSTNPSSIPDTTTTAYITYTGDALHYCVQESSDINDCVWKGTTGILSSPVNQTIEILTGDGTKTFYAWLRYANQISAVATDTVSVESLIPTCRLDLNNRNVVITVLTDNVGLDPSPYSWESASGTYGTINYRQSLQTAFNYTAYVRNTLGNVGSCSYGCTGYTSVVDAKERVCEPTGSIGAGTSYITCSAGYKRYFYDGTFYCKDDAGNTQTRTWLSASNWTTASGAANGCAGRCNTMCGEVGMDCNSRNCPTYYYTFYDKTTYTRTCG